jgi:hypothetical protein
MGMWSSCTVVFRCTCVSSLFVNKGTGGVSVLHGRARGTYITEYVCVVFGGLGIPCLNDLVAPGDITCASVLCCAESWA